MAGAGVGSAPEPASDADPFVDIPPTFTTKETTAAAPGAGTAPRRTGESIDLAEESSAEPSSDTPAPETEPATPSGSGSVGGPTSPPAPADDPGPRPSATCKVTKDGAGFFTRNSGLSTYVAYVPPTYDPAKPMRLVVGLHGCGDSAYNFASWGVNPADTRAKQQHIGISVDGATGNRGCWALGADDDKVLAAVDDIRKCFWVHQKKVVVAGYSSGGQLAYRVGMTKASRFAGIAIENSALYAAGNPDSLLAGATWKIHVAHRAHSGDTVFPLSRVQGDWSKLSTAKYPTATSVVPGGHDGSSADWTGYLLPQSASWSAP